MNNIRDSVKDDINLVEHILRDLSHYKHKRRIREELLTVFENYDTLEPRSGLYVNRFGMNVTALFVSGTLPVNYRSKFYYIPIELWIMSDYPFSAPRCFVKPTKCKTR